MKKNNQLDLRLLEPIDQLDEEEQEIHNALVSGEYVLHTDKATKEKYAKIFKDANSRSKAISLRLKESDFNGIRARAMELGMPYQSLINSIIHRYLMGEFKSV